MKFGKLKMSVLTCALIISSVSADSGRDPDCKWKDVVCVINQRHNSTPYI